MIGKVGTVRIGTLEQSTVKNADSGGGGLGGGRGVLWERGEDQAQ